MRCKDAWDCDTKCTQTGRQASWTTATDKAMPVHICMDGDTRCTETGPRLPKETATDNATRELYKMH
eukprot:10792920-Alexandrium_andersonii.AAC.1